MEPVNDQAAIPTIQTSFPSSFHHTLVHISKSNPFTEKRGHQNTYKKCQGYSKVNTEKPRITLKPQVKIV
jgi:hypothetical protein